MPNRLDPAFQLKTKFTVGSNSDSTVPEILICHQNQTKTDEKP